MNPELHKVACPDPKGKGTHAMAYHAWGDQENPRVLVCVHGLTRNSRDFDFLARELAEHYRVICPDVAGRGQSEWLKKPKWYGYGTYCADMFVLLQQLELAKVDWVGTSMGGLIGMMLASVNPALIGKMVINDIGPYVTKESLERIGEYCGKAPEVSNDAEALSYLKEIFAPWGIADDAVWQHMFAHSFADNYQLAYDPAIGDVFRTRRGKLKKMRDVNLWKMWKKVTVPMLVLRGEESDILLKDIADRMEQSPHVERMVNFPGIGHCPSLMENDQIKLIKNWITH